MHLIDRLPKPIIFAHRGASKYAPENTMAAFHLAREMGAPAFELDSMLSADGIAVVIHDSTLDRTTDGSGKVSEKKLDEIRQFDAGARFRVDFKGEKVPTLEQVLDEFTGSMLVNIELKNYHAPFDPLPVRVAEMARRMNNLDSILFSSFLPTNLMQIKRLLPGAKTALLVEEGFWWRALASRALRFLSPEFIPPNKNYINPSYLEKERKLSRRVNVWTVNDLEEAGRFIHWGIDGLITDDPQGMLELIAHPH